MSYYYRCWAMMVIVCVLGAMLATVTGCSARDTKTQVTSRNVTTSVALESVASTDAPTSTSARPTTPTTAPRTTTTTTTASTTATTPVPSGISWEDALGYVGQEVTIVGPVVGTNYASSSNGSPTFLNVGLPYPDPGRFQVVIWGEDRHRFESPPEDLYYGQNIAVTGVVKNYKGVGEIIVKRPSQIEVH